MADDDHKKGPFEPPSKETGGLEETTGEIEEDATRQISGDALEQIRESAGEDMPPEWLEKMRARKREAERREAEDFDTPVPDAGSAESVVKTEQMNPDDVGSLTEGMGLVEESTPGLRGESQDGDTTEIERDSTKAINRGELDSLMEEKKAELAEASADAEMKPSAPKAGVISKASRNKTERETREVDDEASAAVEETDSADQQPRSSFSLPRPSSARKSQESSEDPPTQPVNQNDDDFGDFSDEDLQAVVFGEDDEPIAEQVEPPRDDASDAPGRQVEPEPRVQESPSLDFSDLADEEPTGAAEPSKSSGPLDEEPAAPEKPSEAATSQADAPVNPNSESKPERPLPESVETEPVEPSPAESTSPEPEPTQPSDDLADVEPPEEFPDYESVPRRPILATFAGILAALIWTVGGALAMFTSLPSPWSTLVPPICLGAGVVAFLIILVGPPRWIEAGILAVLGIGIGGFAFTQWSRLETINITDYLGMAPLVGAGLALLCAVATLVRPAGYIEEF